VTTLATNLTGTDGATLATLDTTLLANGSYVIGLTGTDSSGTLQASGILITVAGEYKPGRVRFSVTDLTVPLTGLPITIGRTYDSLDRDHSGEFGHGWSLSVGSPRLTVDPAHNVTLMQPNGKRVTFSFTPQSGGGVFGYLRTPAYIPEAGVYGSLTADGCTIVVATGGGYVCFLDPNPNYQPTSYTYTDPYGRVYTMGADGTMKAIKDLNGNTLTFSANGIVSSAGDVIVPFLRDSQGRITQITDPVGNIYRYGYDAAGDLVSVALPGATQPVTYIYDASHLIQTIVDARGNAVAAAIYYADGRLASETDAVGNTTSYRYDLATHTTTTTFPDAGVRTQTFDTYGKVISDTDPLDRTTTYVYDTNQKLLSQTDGLGHITHYAYDSKGNLITFTNPLSQTNRYLYNQYGGPTSIT
jgi:YD repeat-containing protein